MDNHLTSHQASIIDQAKAFCLQYGERLTKPRLEVLQTVAGSKKPLGAYEILERLDKILESPKPPTIYRAINFWVEKGFIHCIESLNAYITCHADHRHKGSQFIICDDCGIAIETHLCELPDTLQKSVAKSAFTLSSWNVEIHGQCSQCQSS